MTNSVRIRITPRAGTGDGATHDVQDAYSNIGGRTRLDGSLEVAMPDTRSGLTLPRATLQDVLDRLTAADGKQPRVAPEELRRLGEMLGQCLWGDMDRPDMYEMWIETNDPFVAGLPWALTRTPNGEPPASLGLPVAVSVGPGRESAGLPSHPRMLIAAPNPVDGDVNLKLTGAGPHVTSLRQLLGGEGPNALAALCEILPVVPVTEAELRQALREHRPDILYFYGHGTLKNREGSVDNVLRLLMQKSGEAVDGSAPWPITALADFLDANTAVRDQLGLVYLNCCWGGAAGALGGAMQIGARVPALISNRTSAIIPAAREQAQRILTLILGQGVPPHEAVAQVARESRGLASSSDTVRAQADEPWWMTPTVFADYHRWVTAIAPRRGNRLFTPRETLALDRSDHWGRAAVRLQSPEKPVLLWAWCGAQVDGLHALADRLHDDIVIITKERVRRLSSRAIDWPDESLEKLHWTDVAKLIVARLQAAICGAPTDDTDGLAHVATRLLGAVGGIALIEFSAVPISAGTADAKALLKACVAALGDWLGAPLAKMTSAGRTRIVVLLRFECDPESPLLQTVEEVCDGLDNPVVDVAVLPALGPVRPRDVVTFLERLRERAPSLSALNIRTAISQNIWDETAGRYEATRRGIEDCEHHAP